MLINDYILRGWRQDLQFKLETRAADGSPFAHNPCVCVCEPLIH